MVLTSRHARGSRNGNPSGFSWYFPPAILVVSALLEAGGEPIRIALRYDRVGIAGGEAWRLLTGHFVHLGPSHYAMNAIGLVLVWWLCGNRMRLPGWMAVTGFVIVAIDAGFWFLMPGLSWYVGLSGVLHGLLVAGAVLGLRAAKNESVIILVLVACKLGWEQLGGALPGSELTAGGAVVVDAHLYGAVAGFAAALPLLIRAGRAAAL